MSISPQDYKINAEVNTIFAKLRLDISLITAASISGHLYITGKIKLNGQKLDENFMKLLDAQIRNIKEIEQIQYSLDNVVKDGTQWRVSDAQTPNIVNNTEDKKRSLPTEPAIPDTLSTKKRIFLPLEKPKDISKSASSTKKLLKDLLLGTTTSEKPRTESPDATYNSSLEDSDYFTISDERDIPSQPTQNGSVSKENNVLSRKDIPAQSAQHDSRPLQGNSALSQPENSIYLPINSKLQDLRKATAKIKKVFIAQNVMEKFIAFIRRLRSEIPIADCLQQAINKVKVELTNLENSREYDYAYQQIQNCIYDTCDKLSIEIHRDDRLIPSPGLADPCKTLKLFFRYLSVLLYYLKYDFTKEEKIEIGHTIVRYLKEDECHCFTDSKNECSWKGLFEYYRKHTLSPQNFCPLRTTDERRIDKHTTDDIWAKTK